ncbi:MAG: hypothetical protein KDE32_01845 [Novosphingobium sp.]|nr:hypothetical protein [Novosphingobium sp.]
MKTTISVLAATSMFALASPALAAPGAPIKVSDTVTFDPIVEGRLRYESVDQDNALKNAEAVTMRMRAGGELTISGFSLLAEAEGTLAIGDHYNDTIAGNNGYLGAEPYSVVADPENVEINRLQIGYKGKGGSVTIGRQRIVLDNARFVGNVGWRQNEQTFDAVRGISKFGPVTLDATYAISQRTIFGVDSPREHMDGNLILLNGGIDIKPVAVKGFAYLLDYDKGQPFNSLPLSSKTFGVLAKGGIPLGGKAKLDFMASYARQSDYKDNPVDYSADYIAAELGASVAGFGLKAGYEELGSDHGLAAFQTPLATLHAFNGWADLFLTTPNAGLRDYYGSIGKGFGDLGPLKNLNAQVVYHKFEADFGGADYGEEWDASLGFKVKNYSVLLKYADYSADTFSVDTRKFWFQIEFSY